MPKSIKQPKQPKDITSINPQIQARKDFEDTFEIPVEQAMMSAEDTLSRLTTLNADQDFALREKFDAILDSIASQAKTVADKRIWRQMKAAIEKQRLANVYKEWIETQVEGQFASKIQRNLMSLLNEKRANKAIAGKKAQREQLSMGQEDVASKKMVVANQAATTIQQRMANLRALKAAKARKNSGASTLSNASTSAETLADQKVDGRQFNLGRPSKTIQDKYIEMSEILSKPTRQRSKKEKKRLSNLRGKKERAAPVLTAMIDMVNTLSN